MLMSLLDVLIGLTLVYVLLATAASTAVDFIEVFLRRRGRLLERGIAEIFARTLGAANTSRCAATLTLVEALYTSPYLHALYDGEYTPGGRNLPSAIPPTRFAGAVLALAKENDDLRAAIDRMLEVADLSLDADADTVRAAIATYYQETMDRVTGWYRRHVQKLLFGLGLGFALVLNVDTLQIVRVLSQDEALRAQLVQAAQATDAPGAPAKQLQACKDDAASPACEQAQQAALHDRLASLSALGLPIGWQGEPGVVVTARMNSTECGLAWLSKAAGLLLTALATMLGAPFWFDVLNKLLGLRKRAAPVVAAPRGPRTPA